MPQAFITTSWDDGHPADLRLAEMLARHGLTGTFYIPRSIPSGVMPDSDIKSLSSNFEIGGHTLNHVFLPRADDATACAEIAGSKSWVENLTGRACTIFCPPGGKLKFRHLRMFRDAGYAGFRTVEFLSLDAPRPHDGLREIPTTVQAFPNPPVNYWKNLIKRRAAANFWLYARHGRSSDWQLLARRLLQRTLRVGGVFHLWGHSWELDQAGLWSRLDDVFKLLADARDQAPCLTNGQLCQLGSEERDSAHVRVGDRSASAAARLSAPAPASPPRHLVRD